MENSISLFHLAQTKMRFAVEAQSIHAANIANANTPNYKAKNTLSFEAFFDHALHWGNPRNAQMSPEAIVDERYNPATTKPNGNTVSIEVEMVEAAKAKASHEAALTAFKTSMDILRMSVGR